MDKNYLFFDIECSDGFHICSFGYTLVDKNFKILNKQDIVINPESKFILSSSKNRPKIQLAYNEEYFFSQPNFSHFYQTIKRILTKENQIIVGHSISSDFHFLKYACKRYDLPELELKGYDTQKIYKEAFNKDHVQSLEGIVVELGIKNKLRFHKSSDDAHATMIVAKKMCENFNLSFNKLLEKYPNSLVDGTGIVVDTNKIRFSDKLALLKKKYPEQNRVKVAFAENFKRLSRDKQFEILQNLYENGYDYSVKVQGCQIFVNAKDIDNREMYCNNLIESGKIIKKIKFKDFLKKIGVENK